MFELVLNLHARGYISMIKLSLYTFKTNDVSGDIKYVNTKIHKMLVLPDLGIRPRPRKWLLILGLGLKAVIIAKALSFV